MTAKPSDLPILIAGAGIAGLSAAIACVRRGFTVRLLERQERLEEAGAGIQLGPNATRLLRDLGLLETVRRSAVEPETLRIFDGLSGAALATMPLGPVIRERHKAPYLTVHRADLQRSLLDAARLERTIAIDYGFDLSGATFYRDRMAARSTSGATAEGLCLIGADGLWSAVRNRIAPDSKPQFSGRTAWRTLIPTMGIGSGAGLRDVGAWLGPKAHLVHYPVRGGRWLNVVAVIQDDQQPAGWSDIGDKARLMPHFALWAAVPKALLQKGGAWRVWPLCTLPPLPRWQHGRLALIGDAAHPVPPYLAQGAALALEDAVAIAEALAIAGGDPLRAFPVYESERRARALAVQARSRRLGVYYHLGGPARLARNILLRARKPEAMLVSLDWLYGAGAR